VVDTGLIILAYFAAHWLRFDQIPPDFQATLNKTLLPLACIKLTCFAVCGLYQGMWRYTSMGDIVGIVGANILATAIFATYLGLSFQFERVSRAVVLMDFILSATFICGCRGAIRLYYFPQFSWKDFFRLRNERKRVLVIGAGDSGAQLLREIGQSKDASGYQVVGVVDDDGRKHGLRIHGVPVLGTTLQLEQVVHTCGAEEIFIAISKIGAEEMKRLVRLCNATSLPFKVIPDFVERVLHGGDHVTEVRELRFDDLLGREPIPIDDENVATELRGKRVLVTGAGGSIGAELCRQIGKYHPEELILFDQCEFSLYNINRELTSSHPGLRKVAVIGDVTKRNLLRSEFAARRPQVVFHAAAYKHVSLVEQNPLNGILTNTLGTFRLAQVAQEFGVERFVFISTDKAVRPRSLLGATKRAAEIVLQRMRDEVSRTVFTTVRFGNVVGSTGSVAPLFLEQIQRGGPVTVTHPEVERFFMSIPEAVYLVLQAGTMDEGGKIFVLDMGKPVRILELAQELIRLKGLKPDVDIRIEFTGLRPGEKLNEDLINKGEHFDGTPHPKIKAVLPAAAANRGTLGAIDELERVVADGQTPQALSILATLVSDYAPSKPISKILAKNPTKPPKLSRVQRN
jgi:FlaA1/EpsC-like NDP-sugar epimerase